jgi:hypothetical protein
MIPACDEDDDSSSTPKGTLTVNYDFTGVSFTPCTGDVGDQLVYVYLYQTLGLFPDQWFMYQGISTAILESGSETGSITMNKIPAGDYFVLVFFNKKDHAQKGPGNCEPYMLYDSTNTADDPDHLSTANPYDATNADAGLVTITNGATTTISMVYESAEFISQGAWDI